MVIDLAIGPKFRRFKPGWERRLFKGDKILLHNLFQKGSKDAGPMS
jgi:hypothetical protein